LLRIFAKDFCEPEAAEIDRYSRIPMNNWKQMAKCGLTEVNHDRKYGGAGHDAIAEMIVIEELSKASLTLVQSTHCWHTDFLLLLRNSVRKSRKKNISETSIEDGYIGSFCSDRAGCRFRCPKCENAGVSMTVTITS
jgi:alkylation response protein AidB-like acyl-CoA dehydrogenase